MAKVRPCSASYLRSEEKMEGLWQYAPNGATETTHT